MSEEQTNERGPETDDSPSLGGSTPATPAGTVQQTHPGVAPSSPNPTPYPSANYGAPAMGAAGGVGGHNAGPGTSADPNAVAQGLFGNTNAQAQIDVAALLDQLRAAGVDVSSVAPSDPLADLRKQNAENMPRCENCQRSDGLTYHVADATIPQFANGSLYVNCAICGRKDAHDATKHGGQV